MIDPRIVAKVKLFSRQQRRVLEKLASQRDVRGARSRHRSQYRSIVHKYFAFPRGCLRWPLRGLQYSKSADAAVASLFVSFLRPSFQSTLGIDGEYVQRTIHTLYTHGWTRGTVAKNQVLGPSGTRYHNSDAGLWQREDPGMFIE